MWGSLSPPSELNYPPPENPAETSPDLPKSIPGPERRPEIVYIQGGMSEVSFSFSFFWGGGGEEGEGAFGG